LTLESVMPYIKPMSFTHLPPLHPGEILREEFLKPLGLTASTLARRLSVPRVQVECLLQETADIDASMAARLAACLQTTAEFWLNLQADYDRMVVARRVMQKRRRALRELAR
jgi:addiction module HigA family antidote